MNYRIRWLVVHRSELGEGLLCLKTFRGTQQSEMDDYVRSFFDDGWAHHTKAKYDDPMPRKSYSIFSFEQPTATTDRTSP